MSLRKTLAKVLLFAVLQAGVLTGAPIPPEDIEKIMNAMHRTKIVETVKNDEPVD